ncbi:ABC transporter ATP-binding protein/permease [Bacillus sp. JZ8]
MKTTSRLWNYALTQKKLIILSLLMLIVAVSCELCGPFLAKRMIDYHILGIENGWVEVDEKDGAVHYKDAWYERRDRVQQYKNSDVAEVLLVGHSYYFVPEEVQKGGVRSVEDEILTVKSDKKESQYKAEKLTGNEVLSFYKKETKPIVLLMGVYFFLLVIASVLHFGQRYYLQVSSHRIIQKMREDVFFHAQKLPVSYFDRFPAGQIVSRITNDTEAIRELYVTVLATFVTSIVYIIGVFVALFILDPKLAFACFVIFPILFIWVVLYRKFASLYNYRIRTRISELNGSINESINGMTIIRAFGKQMMFQKEFEHINRDHFTYQNKLNSLNALTSYNLVGFLRNITFVLIIWYFGGGSINGGSIITIGILYAFVDYINRLFEPLTDVVNQLSNLEQARVSASRVFEFLTEEEEKYEVGKRKKYAGEVAFHNVSFGYKEGEEVLHNITFKAQPGETVALVGHTGSGKSSMMNILFRFYDVQKGKITIDGEDISTISKQELRKNMAIVLQDPFLFSGTVKENITLNEQNIDDKKAFLAIKAVGGEGIVQKLKGGMNAPVTERGTMFSTGERQLLSFARALAFNPSILVLDEATANIDTETESVIQHGLDVLKEGRTTFIIAHRLSTIKEADQILVLDKGKIVEHGNHEELMKKRGIYYGMYKTQKGEAS